MPMLSVPWGTVLPDVGATPSSELPKPWAVFRAQGNERLLPWRGAVSGVSYSGNSGGATPAGVAVRFAGAAGNGVQLTFADAPDRANYCIAVLVRINAVAGNDTIFALDMGNPLQARITAANRLELLAEGAALLATSTYAGFTAGALRWVVVSNVNGNTGPLEAYAAGQKIIALGSGKDVGGGATKDLYLGRRALGTSQPADCSIVECWVWSGTLPSPEQRRRITVDGFNTLYAPQQIFISAGGPATYNVDLTETATATDALTVIASYVLAVSESAAATDAASAVATWPRSVSESTTASDIVAAVQTLGAAVSETVTAADLVSAILAASAAISDAASATDAVTSSLNGTIYPVSVDESATSTDAVAAVAQMVAQIAESASSGDAYAVAANLVAVLTETGSPADVVSVPGGYSVSLTEAASALDVVASAVAGVITPSAAPFGHGADAGRRLGALLGRRAGTFARTR